ncbi:MAG: Bax inhibitor-1/YccA family protein [Proteobacteria bacterium]|nr:Bax inhibitor-1/YccA family protein [Pseudomonadota bacterium]
MINTSSVSQSRTQAHVNAFVLNVFHWMTIGLAITGLLAYTVATNDTLSRIILGNKILFFGMIIAELGFVFYLSARISKLSAGTATTLFLFYAALNGATLAPIFLIYTHASIFSTFFVCSATFGACSVYGMITKRDLTSMGSFMVMGLIGVIIASVVNIFLRSSAMEMIITYVGLIVFIGLTAYDTQKIKHMALSQPADLDGGTIRKGAIMGALALYLDFINMFLMLLRLLGDRD